MKTKEKAEEQKNGVLWIDPTIDSKGNNVFMTRVIDGYKYKISASGKTYCAGPYEAKTT